MHYRQIVKKCITYFMIKMRNIIVMQLFWWRFVLKYCQELISIFQTMLDRGIFQIQSATTSSTTTTSSSSVPLLSVDSQASVSVSAHGQLMFSFLCTLVWPFIDSYYASSAILFALQPTKRLDHTLLLPRAQWLASVCDGSGFVHVKYEYYIYYLAQWLSSVCDGCGSVHVKHDY